ncbi:hypothetical protein CYR40_07160 [Chimaeribacter arupi]|uniref:Uncharacterized protein n=1 Tax=Chimaeribacter arupi TaxID=2060066 RepID=A0A2N5ERM7_9GAMM|nr:hypothetical protein CYR23_11115 [Chimaeribacter arupi]PLR47864.1 hypothetical protein CYR40_07160 [Chimaeribacter arupi]PLR52490.1 hypothetical protein CYR34_02975 [Chimaeribacter arupi]PLR53893.1 hypothetical protein CYR52_03750 [Chimaeribacter arupi]
MQQNNARPVRSDAALKKGNLHREMRSGRTAGAAVIFWLRYFGETGERHPAERGFFADCVTG